MIIRVDDTMSTAMEDSSFHIVVDKDSIRWSGHHPSNRGGGSNNHDNNNTIQ